MPFRHLSPLALIFAVAGLALSSRPIFGATTPMIELVTWSFLIALVPMTLAILEAILGFVFSWNYKPPWVPTPGRMTGKKSDGQYWSPPHKELPQPHEVERYRWRA